MSTRLYEQYVVGDTSRHGDLMRRVWASNPWIVNAFTGRCGDDRDYYLRHWLHEAFGDETWPFGDEPRIGRWMRGSATINGWTWIGFATEEDMEAFVAAWPAPEDELPASAPADAVTGQGET